LTSAEAERLAAVTFAAYRDKMLSVKGTVATGTGTVALDGWVDTVDRTGYALIAPDQGGAFLSVWGTTQISARDFTGAAPPLPRPEDGWTTTDLHAQDSALAAAQLLLVDMSADRPENPQLLLQGGAAWLRSDTVHGQKADVMSGPLPQGATVSNLRYWVGKSGELLRLEARLNGRDWSTFDLAPATGVSF
jgi:hypothetical protein